MIEPQIITYKGKYISNEPHLIDQCFVNGQIKIVDKLLTGNGFTTAFLQMNRSINRTVNVLILPNTGAIKSKQEKNKDSRIKFFYSGSGAILETDTKIVVCTTDSFKQYLCEQILNKGIRIDRLLIDEVHSVIQQATFRPILKDFLQYVKGLVNDKKVATAVCVTATPLISMPIDFRFKPNEIAETKIHVNNNTDNVLKEIKAKIKNDEKVVVFTNSYNYIANISQNIKDKAHLNSTIVCGRTLEKKVLKNIPVTINTNSWIVSSAGFEGMDIDFKPNDETKEEVTLITDAVAKYGSDVQIYILQDLNNDSETFILPNIYQALSRTRNGFKKCTYSRKTRQNAYPSANAIVRRFFAIVEKRNVSPGELGRKNKLLKLGFTRLEISILFNCVKFTSDRLMSATHSIPRVEMINYYEEAREFIAFGFDSKHYVEFLANRNITIINESLNENNVGKAFTKDKKAVAEHNKDLIIKRGYDKDHFEFNHNNNYKKDKRTDFVKQLQDYIDFRSCNPLFKPNYKIEIVRDLMQQSLAGHYTKFNAFLKDIVKGYKANKEIKTFESVKDYVISQKEKDAKVKIANFEREAEIRILRLLGYLLNDSIYIPENYEENQNRVYNILTESPMFLIKSICDLLKINLYELDIASCNPRIIYAEVGKQLPEDFYGKDKVNKTSINALFNSLPYSMYVAKCKELRKTPNTIEVHRNYLQKKLGRYNIDKDVTAWLLDNFHKGYTGQLYNFCTKVERDLIEQVKKQLKYLEVPCYRRHDSLLLFNTEHKLTITSEDAYNGITGWFNGFKSIATHPIQELDTTIVANEYEDESEDNREFSNDDDIIGTMIEDVYENGITTDNTPF
jgi:hypothetical protein